jgi:hypothetical protein
MKFKSTEFTLEILAQHTHGAEYWDWELTTSDPGDEWERIVARGVMMVGGQITRSHHLTVKYILGECADSMVRYDIKRIEVVGTRFGSGGGVAAVMPMSLRLDGCSIPGYRAMDEIWSSERYGIRVLDINGYHRNA